MENCGLQSCGFRRVDWNIISTISDAKERLDISMQFLKSEVEGDERINLAIAGFGFMKKDDGKNY